MMNSRFGEGRVHSCTAHLDGDNGVENGDGRLKWLQRSILVGKYTKFGRRRC